MNAIMHRRTPVAFGVVLAALAMAMVLTSPVSADATLTATLTGDAEVPGPGDTDGSGTGSVEIMGDEICYSLSWEISDGTAAAAHIHEAPAGEAGDVVLPLFSEPNDTGTVEGCATDGALAADIEANPANYYLNIHSESFPAGAIRGQLAAAPGGGDTVTVMVMKHNCANVTTLAEFEEVEARAATNPTTPDAAFGPTVETVLECPTVVLSGDTQTEGAVAGGESTFDFTVASESESFTLSTDGTYEMTGACETDVAYDADRSGELDAGVCLDLSHYAFTIASGQVTVTETTPPAGLSFGALRFTPGSGDDATLVSAQDGVIVLDTSADEDGMVMLHVYNFAAAAATTPTPAASMLPDAALAPSAAPSDTTLLGLGLTALALASLGVIGYRTLARRVR